MKTENLPDTLKSIPTPRNLSRPAPYSRELPPISAADAAADAPMFPESTTTTARPDDVTFGRGAARRPQIQVADPLLQWASGLPTNDRRIYAGWLVECGKDEQLDTALSTADFVPIAIRHGSGNIVTHWAIDVANVFLVADGVQTIAEMKGTSDRYGIAFGWRRLPDGRMQSQLRARVFLRELLATGYMEPLLLTVKGTSTGDLLTALMRQYEVLDENARLREAAGKEPWQLPLYAFSIPLGPGQEVTRGSGQATKEITPIVTTCPDPITKEHLVAHWIKRAWVEPIEQLVEPTIAWSVAESAAIAEGSDERLGWEGGEG